MKRFALLLLFPLALFAQGLPPFAPISISAGGESAGGGGSGPYGPASFTTNRVLWGNGTGNIVTTAPGGSSVVDNGSGQPTFSAAGTNQNVVLVPSGTAAVVLPSNATVTSTTGGFQIYNTTDQVTNFERISVYWSANTAEIGFEKAGSGSSRSLDLYSSTSTAAGAKNALFINPPLTSTGTGGYFQFENIGTLSGISNYWYVQIQNPGGNGWTNTAGTGAMVAIMPLYNQGSGNAANTDILVNRTETAIGSGLQYFQDWQVGSSSKGHLDHLGNLVLSGTVSTGANASSVSTVATGTAYTMTAAFVNVTFGTTSPTVTLTTAGTYLIEYSAQTSLVAATYAAIQQVNYLMNRQNNTPATITGTSFSGNLPIITAITDAGPNVSGSILYTTANTNDIIGLQADVSATPSAGSVTCSAATITAVFIHP